MCQMLTRPPKVGVINLILGVIFMVKYDEAFKLKLVNDYLDGDLSYVSLAKKYDIPSPSSIKECVQCWYFGQIPSGGLKY